MLGAHQIKVEQCRKKKRSSKRSMRCWKPAHPRHGEIRGSLSDVARLVPPEAVALKGVLEVAPPIIQTGAMNFKHVMYCILEKNIAYCLSFK
jgi:hypothetical protein